MHDRLAGWHYIELEARLDAASTQDFRGNFQVLNPTRSAGPKIAYLHLQAGMFRKVLCIGWTRRHYNNWFEAGQVDLVYCCDVGVIIRILGLQLDSCPVFDVSERFRVRIHDGGNRAGKHRQAINCLAAIERHRRHRIAADFQYLKNTSGGAENAPRIEGVCSGKLGEPAPEDAGCAALFIERLSADLAVAAWQLDLEAAGLPRAPRDPAETLTLIGESPHGRYLQSDEDPIPQPDLYRLGGTRTLRGYREDQFLGYAVAWGSVEYRLWLDKVSRIYAFFNQGYYEWNPPEGGIDLKWPWGYGVGFRQGTRIGIIGFDFALGQDDVLSTAKVHFRLINRF